MSGSSRTAFYVDERLAQAKKKALLEAAVGAFFHGASGVGS